MGIIPILALKAKIRIPPPRKAGIGSRTHHKAALWRGIFRIKRLIYDEHSVRIKRISYV